MILPTMALAFPNPTPSLDSAPPPVGSGFWTIIIEDRRGKWAYYTQNETIFNEYTERGFCDMSRPFREQFDHTCPDPKTDERIKEGAKCLATAIIVMIFLALLATSIKLKYIARLKKRRAKNEKERRCKERQERTLTKKDEADSVETRPHARDVEWQNGVAGRVYE